MSDGQAYPNYLSESPETPTSPVDAPNLQEAQQQDPDIPFMQNIVVQLNQILVNQATIINNQQIIDGKLNSVGQMMDYMAQTVQAVGQQFAGGKGLQGLLGMLGGQNNVGGNQSNG